MQTRRFNLWYVYWATLAMLLALCMMFSLYPARQIPMIINMAPSTDHASERVSLAQQCIFLARELVLDDGFSRMTKVVPSFASSVCVVCWF